MSNWHSWNPLLGGTAKVYQWTASDMVRPGYMTRKRRGAYPGSFAGGKRSRAGGWRQSASKRYAFRSGPLIRRASRYRRWTEAPDMQRVPNVFYTPRMSEMLYDLTELAATEVASDSTHAACLNPLPEGSDAGERIGRSVMARQVDIRYQVVADTIPATMRIIVLRDDAPVVGGADPDLSDVLGGTVGVRGFYNTNNRHRFHIYYDRVISVVPSVGALQKNGRITINMNHVVRFEGDQSTDYGNGSVYIMATSDIAVASTGPTLAYCALFRYQNAA